MNARELKPCPFCGGDSVVEKTRHGRPIMKWVVCNDCGSSSSAFNMVEDAISSWNNRAPILRDDETHAPTERRALDLTLPALKAAAYKIIADEHNLGLAEAVEANGWQWPDDGPAFIHGTIHQVLVAIRALIKEGGEDE